MKENLYITSDLHYWHINICKLCNRPYTTETLSKMNHDILAEFDKLPAGSIILNLGDLYLHSSKTFNQIKYLVDRMKANDKQLWIVLGNHDFANPSCMKGYQNKTAVELYKELGFDKVYDRPFIMDNIVFTHEPIRFPEGVKVVHGHIHDKNMDLSCFDPAFDKIGKEILKLHPELIKKTNKKKGNTNKNKGVNLKYYFNVCWDKHHRILKYNEILKGL